MLGNIIREAKLAAMDAVQDVKDIVHDVTTTLPDEKPIDFKDVDKQSIITPHSQGLEYMTNGWGLNSATMTANQIDMIVDKMNFVANMIQNALLNFDTIEAELKFMASQSVPPQPAQLMGIAARIDGTQKQTFDGLQQLRRLAMEVDKATDQLQNKQNHAGWNTQVLKSLWDK